MLIFLLTFWLPVDEIIYYSCEFDFIYYFFVVFIVKCELAVEAVVRIKHFETLSICSYIIWPWLVRVHMKKDFWLLKKNRQMKLYANTHINRSSCLYTLLTYIYYYYHLYDLWFKYYVMHYWYFDNFLVNFVLFNLSII